MMWWNCRLSYASCRECRSSELQYAYVRSILVAWSPYCVYRKITFQQYYRPVAGKNSLRKPVKQANYPYLYKQLEMDFNWTTAVLLSEIWYFSCSLLLKKVFLLFLSNRIIINLSPYLLVFFRIVDTGVGTGIGIGTDVDDDDDDPDEWSFIYYYYI